MEADFLSFLFRKVYRSSFSATKHIKTVEECREQVYRDYELSHPGLPKEKVNDLVCKNGPGLPVFLYRFGRALYTVNRSEQLLSDVHWLIKEVCSMEIYFSTSIEQGFEVRHGEGTVIGSRAEIGTHFVIHQGCTVGHRRKFGDGPIIGNHVEMGVGSAVLGKIRVGDRSIIGAHSLVLHDVPEDTRVKGIH